MRLRLRWTTCGLLWCLAVVSDARRLSPRQEVSSLSPSGLSAIPPPPSSTSAPPSGSSAGSSSIASAPTSSSSPSIPPAPDTPPTSPPRPVPTPLDLTISYSLSDDCVMFMTSFLTNTLFQSCLPFSLLLTTSTSYRQIVASASENHYELLNNLIAYTSSPQPSSQQCDDYFAGLRKSLGEKKHCAADLDGKDEKANPVAMDTQRGLGNYKIVREASALRDPASGTYCYLQAMADSRPDDMYLWSLPAGIPLPSGSTPTCSPCSASLLNHFASCPSSDLNSTLVLDAINTVNSACGGSLVTHNNISAPNSASLARGRPTSISSAAVAAGLLALFSLSPILSTF